LRRSGGDECGSLALEFFRRRPDRFDARTGVVPAEKFSAEVYEGSEASRKQLAMRIEQGLFAEKCG
jgi:hypothetical protein